jgi:AcrR family transcriptional regulator
MSPTAAQVDQRRRLLDAALQMLEELGPEALQTRRITSEVGTSTQAIYTQVGGMPGLFEALVADGFERFGEFVAAVPKSDDPVADFFSEGAAYTEWAFAHPQLYRLMFGLTGAQGLRLHTELELTTEGPRSSLPEALAAAQVMVSSLERVKASGRIDDVDPLIAAGQFLSATHGAVLLAIGGAFGDVAIALEIMGRIAVNLIVGLGDERTAAERSLQAALAARGNGLPIPPVY